ncbi:MAG: Gfo/Idh/MocA family protein [Planctomycetota bacterium]
MPVAVIGVGGFGRWTLQALQSSQAVEVVGISDRDAKTAERVGEETHVAAYGDNRSLLAETRPKAVYLAVPPTAAPEIVNTCARRGIHVWKELPLARSLAEGLALVKLMDAAGLKLAVGTQRRFAVGYRRAWELRRTVGQVFLGRAHYLFNWGPNLAWRGDRASAGGGALLELGYHLVDLMVWMLGLPEDVYGVNSVGNRPDTLGPDGKRLPLYDTDDTAAAILRYADGAMATVVTTRSSGPVSEEFCLHGRAGSLRATSESCALRNPDGNLLDEAADSAPPVEIFRRQAEAFAKAVATDAKRYECSGRENLLNLAVIEALYLSNRTGQPERPENLLASNDLTVENCLKLRPLEDVEPADLPDSKTGRQPGV